MSEAATTPPPLAVATGAALISTALISLAPNVILFFFPNTINNNGKNGGYTPIILSASQSLAAGGLLGDVFLHSLPDCYGNVHGEEDSYIVGLVVLSGFGIFLILDSMVRTLGGGRHHHDHDHHAHDDRGLREGNGTLNQNGTKEKLIRTSLRDNEESPKIRLLSSTIILNLAADSLHNFTDGLAIGASFASASSNNDSTSSSYTSSVFRLLRSRGSLASASILFHEIPHELGDYAILVGSGGFTKYQAIVAQFGTAVAAMLGTVVGVAAVSLEERLGRAYLQPFTAGGFVYLAGTVILPEVLGDHGRNGWKDALLTVGAFVLGVSFMCWVVFLEHGGGGHHHHHHHQHEHDSEF